MQGLLELAGIPYVGAGVAASALAMDKDLFKKVLRDSGIPVARHHTIRLGDAVENPFGYPVFVKPARLGSSVGISKAHDESELGPGGRARAAATTRRCSSRSSCAGSRSSAACSATGSPRPSPRFPATSTRSSTSGTTSRPSTTRAGWSSWSRPSCREETIELVQRRAVDAFVASECEGMARVDFFVREDDGEVLVNELNTIPGFTATSVYARLFEASGIAYAELLDRLIELALERAERRAQLEY